MSLDVIVVIAVTVIFTAVVIVINYKMNKSDDSDKQ